MGNNVQVLKYKPISPTSMSKRTHFRCQQPEKPREGSLNGYATDPPKRAAYSVRPQRDGEAIIFTCMHCLLSKSTWLSVLFTAAALTGSAQKWVYYGRVPAVARLKCIQLFKKVKMFQAMHHQPRVFRRRHHCFFR